MISSRNCPHFSMTDALQHARAQGFLTGKRDLLDQATRKKLPTPLLRHIEDYAFDGLVRAAKDMNALTPDLQKQLIKVLQNESFTFSADQLSFVFRHVQELRKTTKKRENKELLSTLRDVLKNALIRETRPDGKVISSLVRENERQKCEIEHMLKKAVPAQVNMDPEARKSISFFATREIRADIKALTDKRVTFQGRILETLNKITLPWGGNVSNMFEIGIEDSKFAYAVEILCSRIKLLSHVDSGKALELRQNYLHVVRAFQEFILSRFLKSLKVQGNAVGDVVQTSLNAPSLASIHDVFYQSLIFTKMHTLALNTTKALHKCSMKPEFCKKPLVIEDAKDQVTLAELEAELMRIQTLPLQEKSHLEACVKQIAALEPMVKKIRSSIEKQDFTEDYETLERFGKTMQKFNEVLLQHTRDAVKTAELRPYDELQRLANSGMAMSIAEQQHMESLMNELKQFVTLASEIFVQARKLVS